MQRRLADAWEWLQASDPGLSRLRMAGSAAIAMATALGVEMGFADVMHVSPKSGLIAMILGAMVAMLGAIALTATGNNARAKALTALFFPVSIGAGMALGVAVGGHTDLMLSVFVVVMFVGAFVRRFGPAYFFYGFMFWLGYFFASLLNATLAMLPFFMEAVILGSAWVLLLSLVVFRVNPTRTMQRTVRAFDARARGVVRPCARLLQSAARNKDSHTQRRLRRRIESQERRLTDTALMIEGWSAEPAALPSGQSAATLRRQLIGAQQAMDTLVATTLVLSGSDDQYRASAARIATQLADRNDSDAEHDARKLQEACTSAGDECTDTTIDDDVQRAAYRFASATIEFIGLARAARYLHKRDNAPDADEADEFEPTAGLVMGNLPGSPSVARGLHARGARWNPLARLDLSSRQAIQVALAGGLAIVAGRALSPTRYYWAVIAAFIMFSGTATRSETFLKGFNRVLGTALGLAAAVGLAELTAGHSIAIVTTIVLSMFCGFYLMRVGYAYMIFFVTIMVAQLYTVLHEFSPGLLVLRLEETAIGAGIGFAVAVLLMPLSTRDTVRDARHELLKALAELLNAAADHADTHDHHNHADARVTPDSEGRNHAGMHALSRALDDHLRRYALVAQPLTRPLLGGGNHVLARHRLNSYVAIATSARALVVALDAPGAPGATTLARYVGETTRSLAAAAAHLADVRPGKAGSDMADRLADAKSTLSRVDATRLRDPQTMHVVQALRRLHYLLQSLGGTPRS